MSTEFVGREEALHPAETRATRRRKRGVLLLVVAAYGPYMAGGIRSEQVVVYSFALGVIFWLVNTTGKPRPVVRDAARGWAPLAISWLLLLVVAAVGTIGASAPAGYEQGSLTAGADNLALPLAIMLICVWLRGVVWDSGILTWALRVTSVMGGLNAIVALMQVAGLVDHMTLLPWMPGQAGDVTVASLAEQLGRFSGVFNQPAEAGLAYSVAAISAIYGFRKNAAIRYALLCLITIGGVLSVSKVFIIAGVPTILWLLTREGLTRIFVIAAMGGVLAVATQLELLATWTGRKYFLRLFDIEGQSLVTLLTAGRFGETTSLAGVVDTVREHSPLVGFGLRGLRTPYDNALVESLVLAGVVGVLLFLFVVATLLHKALSAPRQTRRLPLALVFVTIAASFGVPALTANRASSVLWLLLGLTLVSPDRLHAKASNCE